MKQAQITLSNFNIDSLKNAYLSLKTEGVLSATLYLVMAIAIMLIISEIIKIYLECSENGRPDMKLVLKLSSKYLFFLAIIGALPHCISLIEQLLASVEDSLLSSWGKAPDVGFSVLEKEYDAASQTMGRQGDFFGIFSILQLDLAIDLLVTTAIKPWLCYGIKHLYILTVFGRYAYLLMLEVVAPIAIVCLISAKTEQYFYTWLKNMMICYLMVPFFMLGDAFINLLWIMFAENDRYTFFIMLMAFISKLWLFNFIRQRTFNLI